MHLGVLTELVLLLACAHLAKSQTRSTPPHTTTDQPTTTPESTTTTEAPTTTGTTTTVEPDTTTVDITTTTVSSKNYCGLKLAYGNDYQSLFDVDDGCASPINMPYDIPFANKTFRSIYVCVNGLVCFDRPYDGYYVPRNGDTLSYPGHYCVAPFMMDLNTVDTGKVWYHVYDLAQDCSLANNEAVVKTRTLVRENYDAGYVPALVLAITWDAVYAYDAQSYNTATFQLVFTTDGEKSYSFFFYGENRMKIMSGFAFIGQIINSLATGFQDDSTDGSYLRRPDNNLKWKNCYGAAVIRHEQAMATNYGVKCRKWHACESDNAVTYRNQFNGMPLCPCTLNQGFNDPNFDFGFNRGSYYTVNLINNPQFAPYSKTCGYSGITNSLIAQGKYSGSFTKYNPITNPTSYASEDLYYKELCCERSDLCSLFFAVRPGSSECDFRPRRCRFGFTFGHFTTLDNLTYTFNGHGEYILLALPEKNIEIQARMEPYITANGTVAKATVFTAFVVKGPDFWIQVELTSNRSSLQIYAGQNKSDAFNADYTLDYYTDGDNFKKSFTQFTMSRYNQTLQIKITAGITFNITHVTDLLQFGLCIDSSLQSNVTGLLGNFNDNPADDLKPRNSNTPLNPNSTEETIFNDFGQTWTLSAEESHFRYTAGKSYATYNFPNFQPIFYETISRLELSAAATACGNSTNKQCIYDYVVTGNQAFLLRASLFVDNLSAITKIADNQIPTLTVTSGVRTVNGQYYLYARIGTPVYFVVEAIDTGPVTINMTTNTASARLTKNSNGSVRVNLTLENSTPVDIGFVGTDEKGASSSIIVITVVACTGCSSHGTCDYTRFQQVDSLQDNFELALCVCEPYWEGADCSADVNGCAVSPCAAGQNCTDRPALEHKANSSLTPYTCSSCPTGFKISGVKCADINECTPNNPCVGGTCTNTEGSFKCACPAGYRLDTDRVTCKDINECEESSDTCDHICTNIAPGFKCTCYKGYKRNATNTACILDANNPLAVCQNSQCANATGCTEVNGSAQCFCLEGYSLQSNNSCTNKNECLLGVCSQGCTETVGSFTCNCYTGYTLNADRVTCNPCPFPTYGLQCASRCQCGRGSTGCSPIHGCVCAPGWTGVDCDTDINECLDANACGDARKVCRNNDGSFSCSCRDGYQLVNGTCADIDECADSTLNRCEQSCSNSVGGFTCSCRSGYVTDATDDTQCNDINECALQISGCVQICVNLDGRYNCECNQGFELNTDRRTCTKVPSEDPCASFTSKNCSDICTVMNGTAVCLCRSGYRLGADLQTCIDINECTNPSLNGCLDKTSCVNSAGSYGCSCAPGLKLENDLRTCKACDEFHWGVNCGNSCDCGVGATTCNAVTGCVCGQGWTGDKCDADKNECDANPCTANNEECVNTPGSYECLCQTGFEKDGSGNCVNINECSYLTLNQCSQICTDTAGSYICSCNPGFVKNGTNCFDINECLGQHGCQQLCVNTEGSYRCSCQAGFLLNDDKKTCRAAIACTSDPCSGGYVCANINGFDTCTCNIAYEFDTGSTTNCRDIKECASNSTNRCTQACIETAGGYMCSCDRDGYKLDTDLATCIACDEGTYGDDCLQNCLCETVNKNTKSCNKVNGTCTCWDGWTGARCQTNIDECVVLTDPCPSNSACVDTQGSYHCVCSIGFIKLADGTCSECDSTHYGFGCSKPCTCVSANTGDCGNVDGKCTCLPGWTGTDCSVNINECLTVNKCNDSLKTCSDTVGSYTCSCITGYTINNQHVCIDDDECLLGTHTCSGTGRMCKNTAGSFTCVCQPGYSGDGATCVACPPNKWGYQCLNNYHYVVNNTQQCNAVNGSCVCKSGWTGANCSQDIDECTTGTHNCTSTSACTNIPGGYNCPCATGYKSNINSCVACDNNTYGNNCTGSCNCVSANVISSSQMCNHVTGTCQCMVTWKGDKCQTDVDECVNNSTVCKNKANSGCRNTAGGYLCSCIYGYIADNNTGDCVASGVTPGETGIDLTVKLNFSIEQYLKTHNRTGQLTNDEFKEEVTKGLTIYFSKEMEDINFKRLIVRWTNNETSIANITVIIAETDDSRKDFSQAVHDLLRGGIVPVFNQNTSVLEMTIGSTVVDPTAATQTWLTCLAYFEARGVCQINEDCVINNGQPTCQLRKAYDDFAVILGLGVGIPLFLVAVLVIAACLVYCCRRKKRGTSYAESEDRSTFDRGFFVVGIPTRLHTGNYVAYSWDRESSASFTSSSDDTSTVNDNKEERYFSWDFLSNYLGPNEKYKIKRPHLQRKY